MPPQIGQSGYFEQIYQGPYKGIHVAAPENMIPENMSPLIQNFVLKNAELRTRFRISPGIIGPPPGGDIIDVIDTFQDGNTVFHTVIVNRRGLWQLNPNFANPNNPDWSQIGAYPVTPGPDIPVAHATFLNKFYWTNGGNNLWVWDGIQSIGSPFPWPASTFIQAGTRIVVKVGGNPTVQICIKAGWTGTVIPAFTATVGAQITETTISPHIPAAIWVCNGAPAPTNGFWGTAVVDALNGITAGAFYLGVLAARMLMLSTIEGSGIGGQPFNQRVRWCASGQPSIWDPNVNIGAGYTDFLEVPDFITGFMAIGDKTGFVFRQNGITEMTAVSDGVLPFDFNHLWASDRGIGNVLPFSISAYGPIGMFIASDDVYNISIGGFKNVGGPARDAIFADIAAATGGPLSAIIPKWTGLYSYLSYLLAIPQGQDTKFWMYSLEDGSWTTWLKKRLTVTGRANFVATQ